MNERGREQEPGPPRFTRWIVSRAIRAEDREFVVGDLDEEFVLRGRSVEARRWYRSQAVRSAVSSLLSRMRDTQEAGTMSRTDGGRGILVGDLVADLRFASRMLRRTPGTSLTVVLTIALGIGGTTAVFGIADQVILRPLPVHAPEELVFLGTLGPEGRNQSPPYPMFDRIREQAGSFSGMAAFAVDHLPVVVEGEPEQVLGQIASGSYFDVLGVRAALGRTFTAEDEVASPTVAVVSHRYWRVRFGGRPDVLGRVVRYRGHTLTIVGVTEPGFVGLDIGYPVDVTMPITVAGAGMLGNERARWFGAVARLSPGVPMERARAEADRVLRAGVAERTTAVEAAPTEQIRLTPASHGVGGLRAQFSTPILLMGGLMVVVLVIVCANIANLLIARTEARRRELATRAAIGAGRLRVTRQLLTETLLLFSIGAVAGAFVARVCMRWMAHFLAVGRIPILLDLELEARALAFTGALCLVTAFLAGVLPAIRFSQHGNFGDLRARTPSRSSTRSGLGGGRGLVVLQVAAAVVLLVDGGLLVRTLRNLTALDVGFRSEGVLTLSVQPLGAATRREREQAFGEVLSRVEGLPESRGATLSVLTPLSGRDPTGRVEVPGYQPRSDADLDVVPNYVSAGYFEAFGIRLEQGRSFTTWDDADAPRVAILGATPARFYFGSTNPLGARIVVDSAGTALTYEVIGVAADVKHRTLREEPQRSVYLPIWQAPEGASRLTLSIRAAGSPVAMIDRVREEIRRAGGEILVSDVQTMDQQMDQALLGERLLSSLSTVLAALGVLLAAIGLYGLASHAVVRRTTEMGIRMALGAPGETIRWIMLRDTAGMVCIGVAVGLPLSLLGGWALRNRLFGVSPADPATLVVCAAILGAVAGLAAYLPARRASRIDPVLTLNGD